MISKQQLQTTLKIARTVILEVGLTALCAILGMLLIALFIRSAPDFVKYLLSSVGLLIGAFFYQQIARYLNRTTKPKELSERAERPTTLSSWLWIALYFGLAMVGSYGLSLLMHLLGFPVQEQLEILRLVGQGFRWQKEFITFILAAVILAPIAEEWLLRGLLFRRLQNQTNLPIAYAVSCLVFAAMHDNISGFVVYAWLGYVFARCYQRTGRLWTAMLVHAGNNAFTLAMLLWMPNQS